LALMKMLTRTVVSLLVFALCGQLQAAPPVITLANGQTVALSDSMLAPLQKHTVTATAHGKSARYEGYALVAVLKAAGVDPVESLRGKQLSTTVEVAAADGYRVVFALAELDPTLGNKQVLLVDRENGQPLPDGDGPWRLVVASDQRPARWVRQVEFVAVSSP
jgi:hypothetical protein